MWKENLAYSGEKIDSLLLWLRNLNLIQQALILIAIVFIYYWLINSMPRGNKSDN